MPHPFIVAPRGGSAPTEPRPVPRHPVVAPLRQYLADPDVTDVFVNGTQGLYVDRGAGAERVPGWSLDEGAVRELAVGLIALGGRHLDDATPCADVRWEHGVRVHAVLPPIACTGATISIRLPGAGVADLDELGRRGTFDAETGSRLERLVDARANILVTGATGAGNTTWNL
ncbi:ATPase, T2SS/T4P/T4SS family [Microbacterium sp. NPDC077663]|uniref:ATPase, T2SS/T4P/T4SS family n=1 Tax=Microbacterium sp. NPDC077663 TaxID=3364189 RepID=UPI0037C82B3D